MAPGSPRPMRASLVLLAALIIPASGKIYKLCATEWKAQDWLCAGLNKGNTEVTCARVVDSADCARQLYSGSADFAVLSAEELLLGSKFKKLNESLRIVAEIRHVDRENDAYAFEAVVIVRSDYSGLISGLKGKNFCHPGFADSQEWTDRVLKYFERQVVPQTCDVTKPLVEDEMNNLVKFFNSSCRPGPWSLSDYRDRQLKKKYPQLCALCDSQDGCSYNTQRSGSQEAALRCLTSEGSGDVTYVALQYARDYFGLNDRKAQADPDLYRFLCPDGSMQLIKSKNPCTWLKQPWPAVVAPKDITIELRTKLQSWLTPTTSRVRDTWQNYLSQILFTRLTSSSDRAKINTSSATSVLNPTMAWYLSRGRNDTGSEPPAESTLCRPSVRWCVVTPLEYEKCDTLRIGAYTFGLEPSIQCVRATSMWECMAAVKNMTADILAIDTEYSLIARQTYNLSPLIYQETAEQQGYHILAVVRPESGITKLADLNRKTACFPEYGGLAWTAWLDTARSLKLLSNKCPASAAVADFFYRACAPGADDSVHNPGGTGRSALCALCPALAPAGTTQATLSKLNKGDLATGDSKCATNSRNGYYSDAGALRCLVDKQGDAAFVDLRSITDVNYLGQISLRPEYRSDEYRVLCRNGSVSTRTGLLVDKNCALASGVGGELVSRNPLETISVDAALLLLDLENWFGYGKENYESALNMFGSFRGIEDVIFKRSVVGFVSIYDRENTQAAQFASLMERSVVCSTRSGSPGLLSSSAVLLSLTALAAVAPWG